MKIVHANILLFFYSLLHIQMDTLCYLTPSTDGDHAPECLLESCIYMETANTIGQMLQQNKDKIVIEKNKWPAQFGMLTHRQDLVVAWL